MLSPNNLGFIDVNRTVAPENKVKNTSSFHFVDDVSNAITSQNITNIIVKKLALKYF